MKPHMALEEMHPVGSVCSNLLCLKATALLHLACLGTVEPPALAAVDLKTLESQTVHGLASVALSVCFVIQMCVIHVSFAQLPRVKIVISFRNSE